MDEQTIFDEVLEQYRDAGYEVQLEPPTPELPSYLADGKIDAIARKGTQVAIFQAKFTPGLSEERVPTVLVTDEPDLAYAKSLLNEVELLLRADTARAALLTAWAAAEAAMRAVARQEKFESDRLTPSRLLEQFQERKLISAEEFLDLRYFMNLRNSVAHGFRPTNLPQEAVIPLIHLTRRLIDPKSVPQDSRKGSALLTTVSGDGLKNLDELRRVVTDANDILAEMVGNTAGIVSAEWEKAEDAVGHPVVTLRLSDFTGKVTATFDPKEFQDRGPLRLRLHQLWGELLQARSEKRREELMKRQHRGEK